MKYVGIVLMFIGGLCAIGSIGNDDYQLRFPMEPNCGSAQNFIHFFLGAGVVLVGWLLYRLAKKRREEREISQLFRRIYR